MKAILPLVLYCLLQTSPTRLPAQARTTITGLNLIMETSSGSFRTAAGMVLERQLTQRSGIETGLYYRNFVRDGTVSHTDSTGARLLNWSISERYVSVPVLFKFYSRVVNISAGAVFDFYAGWRQRDRVSTVRLNEYNVNPHFFFGFLTKASKTINLSDRFFIEPEVRFHPSSRFNNYRTGIGVSGKYRM